MKRNILKIMLLYHSVANAQLETSSKKFLELELHLMNGNYYSTLEVGSNKDSLEVLIDTGSADLWFPSVDNVYCIEGTNVPIQSKTVGISTDSTSDQFNCSVYGVFDYANSETFKWNGTTFTMAYVDGSDSSGEWGQDEMFIVDESIGYINFGVANESSNEFGTLGLGLSGLEETNFIGTNKSYRYENFPLKLKRNGIISSASYSIFSGNGTDGSLLFGAIDHSKYVDGTLYKFPMVNAYLIAGISGNRSVSITLNSIWIIQGEESTEIVEGYFAVIIDSGTQTAVLPYSVVKNVREMLNLSYDESTGVWFVECDELREVMFVFNFQGVDYDVPISNFFLEIDGASGVCGLAVQSTYISQYLVLGQSFLSNIYMSVNLEEYTVALGMIEESGSENDRDMEVITTDGIPSAMDPPLDQTYDASHVLYSTLGLSTTTLASSINYSTVFIKSVRQVGSVDATATSSITTIVTTTSTTTTTTSSSRSSVFSASVSVISTSTSNTNGSCRLRGTAALLLGILLLCVVFV